MAENMERKTILLVEDDPKTEAAIRDALAGEYHLEVAARADAAEAFVEKKKPDLVLIDYDLAGVDGLQVFKKIQALMPQIKAVMLSLSNHIPLAVSAAKLGVAEFLRKPVEGMQLRKAVEGNLSPADQVLIWPSDIEWLHGNSAEIITFFGEVQKNLLYPRNWALFGEPGIEMESVAAFAHVNSLKRKRQMKVIDLSSFRRQDLEAHFWATVQEIMGEAEIGSVINEEDRCGTLYLKNIETLEESFRMSVLDYFKERKGKVDKAILVIIGLRGKETIPAARLKTYFTLEVPPLRRRKEDIPYLLNYYLKYYSDKNGKPIKGISADLLDFAALYDYPGNYRELEKMMEGAVLASSSDVLELKDLFLDFRGILEHSLKDIFRSGELDFSAAKERFENSLYRTLLSKNEGDIAAVARYLDIPKTVLAERIEGLG
jgi:DNA-binding NtrC family response regulator